MLASFPEGPGNEASYMYTVLTFSESWHYAQHIEYVALDCYVWA